MYIREVRDVHTPGAAGELAQARGPRAELGGDLARAGCRLASSHARDASLHVSASLTQHSVSGLEQWIILPWEQVLERALASAVAADVPGSPGTPIERCELKVGELSSKGTTFGTRAQRREKSGGLHLLAKERAALGAEKMKMPEV